MKNPAQPDAEVPAASTSQRLAAERWRWFTAGRSRNEGMQVT